MDMEGEMPGSVKPETKTNCPSDGNSTQTAVELRLGIIELARKTQATVALLKRARQKKKPAQDRSA